MSVDPAELRGCSLLILRLRVRFHFPAPHLHSNWTLLGSLIVGAVGRILCLAIAWGFVLWAAAPAGPSALLSLVPCCATSVSCRG